MCGAHLFFSIIFSLILSHINSGIPKISSDGAAHTKYFQPPTNSFAFYVLFKGTAAFNFFMASSIPTCCAGQKFILHLLMKSSQRSRTLCNLSVLCCASSSGLDTLKNRFNCIQQKTQHQTNASFLIFHNCHSKNNSRIGLPQDTTK